VLSSIGCIKCNVPLELVERNSKKVNKRIFLKKKNEVSIVGK